MTYKVDGILVVGLFIQKHWNHDIYRRIDLENTAAEECWDVLRYDQYLATRTSLEKAIQWIDEREGA